MNKKQKNGLAYYWLPSCLLFAFVICFVPPTNIFSDIIAIGCFIMVAVVWPILWLKSGKIPHYKIRGPWDNDEQIWLYWSNENGWVDFDSAQVFSDKEVINMPIETTAKSYIDSHGKIVFNNF